MTDYKNKGLLISHGLSYYEGLWRNIERQNIEKQKHGKDKT